MTIEEINKKIQQEKDSHARKINRLKNEICKQNERHQRTMEYLQNQKEREKELEQARKTCENKMTHDTNSNYNLLEQLYYLIEKATEGMDI